MKSSFKFLSFKVDRAKFQIQQTLGLLELNEAINSSHWTLNLQIRKPVFFKGKKTYVGGVDCHLSLSEQSSKPLDPAQSIPALVVLEMGIAGSFSVDEGQMASDIEQNLVKIQIPAILLPYLRSAMSGFLASAGFGSVVLPLINVQEYSRQALKDVAVELLD